MQKKDDKVGNKTAYKKKCKEEKNRARKKIEIDSPKKKERSTFGLCACLKKKKLLNFIQLAEI